MKIRLLTLGLFLISCSVRTSHPTYTSLDWQVINYNKTFKITVDKFVKSSGPCLSHGSISYALVVGRTENNDLPERLSVLLASDNNLYDIGQSLEIRPIDDPTKAHSLKPIYLVKDTLINGQKTRYIIGSENPRIWGMASQPPK